MKIGELAERAGVQVESRIAMGRWDSRSPPANRANTNRYLGASFWRS